jgi:hypothetical protein
MKLSADRAGLPGKVISFYIVPLDPAYLPTGRQARRACGALPGQAGKTKIKRLPSPSLLSAQTLPP